MKIQRCLKKDEKRGNRGIHNRKGKERKNKDGQRREGKLFVKETKDERKI